MAELAEMADFQVQSQPKGELSPALQGSQDYLDKKIREMTKSLQIIADENQQASSQERSDVVEAFASLSDSEK